MSLLNPPHTYQNIAYVALREIASGFSLIISPTGGNYNIFWEQTTIIFTQVAIISN